MCTRRLRQAQGTSNNAAQDKQGQSPHILPRKLAAFMLQMEDSALSYREKIPVVQHAQAPLLPDQWTKDADTHPRQETKFVETTKLQESRFLPIQFPDLSYFLTRNPIMQARVPQQYPTVLRRTQ